MREKVLMKGCEAIAEAAVRAGCRFFSGYPITPQNEIPEYLSWRLPEIGGVYVQGESEIAAISMIYGAASTGTRAMTSSSSPGISLKTEGISYLASTNLPCVILNFMRGGPGIGTIQASQSDYFQAVKAPGHGGHRCLVYVPYSVQEAVDTVRKAFDKSQKYRTPVIILVDGVIGAVMEPVMLPEMLELDPNEGGDWALTGNESRLGRDIRPFAHTIPGVVQDRIDARVMYEHWAEAETEYEEYMVDDAEYVIAAYGSSARIAKSTIRTLREQGVKIGLIRPITAFPFPNKPFDALDLTKVKKVITVEMTDPPQFVEDVALAINGRIPVESACVTGGIVPALEDITALVEQHMER
jgi:2-oxoglutarate/2-oxoacid ferredoxin oxidoreductase subunit alpha